MRTSLLVSVAAVGLLAGTALAQNAPQTAPGSTAPPAAGATGAMAQPQAGTQTGGQMGAQSNQGQQGMQTGSQAGTENGQTGTPQHYSARTQRGTWGRAGEPFSTRASNIDRADTSSTVAPALPTPSGGPDAGADHYLRDAQRALSRGQTGLAQEAIERAQTAFLNLHVARDEQGNPIRDPRVETLNRARHALANNNLSRARDLVAEALGENRGQAFTGRGPGATSAGAGINGGGVGYSGPGGAVGAGTGEMGTDRTSAGAGQR